MGTRLRVKTTLEWIAEYVKKKKITSNREKAKK